MNVLFINTFYFPEAEERARLQHLQDELSHALIELHQQTRHLGQYDRMISKQRYHAGFKDRWLVYPGFKVDKKEETG